jgi:hypothetical protein
MPVAEEPMEDTDGARFSQMAVHWGRQFASMSSTASDIASEDEGKTQMKSAIKAPSNPRTDIYSAITDFQSWVVHSKTASLLVRRFID